MTRKQLIEQIQTKKSYLCVGLDTDIKKIPAHLQSHPNAVFEFNKQIIDATQDLCIAYKLNTAFYEAMGVKGWQAMEDTVKYIPKNQFIIADAKRGDIGNTSTQYAKAFFETMDFDAITVAPYMGEDSVRPFLAFENKWAIVLGLTSNAGSKDFEQLKVVGHATNNSDVDPATNNSKEYLYESVLKKVSSWGTDENLMFVVGATKASDLLGIRKIIPEHFLLVPGVGFQGGSLAEVSKYGMNKDCGLLVNASRAIIYAGEKEDFANEARAIAKQYQTEMAGYLS
ncbi:MAG: orotidine-5'-phosphate decarboxylase [Ferruginibacter sp.]|nr:orotidine-5'-phosphate decarboxylase [Bacteroidota bacterium]MBX2920123.1 orotidine-5'-phosphate decarboxylase [Ferruginibacter sp.]MCC7377967.1 orotidine-5'-phosphate decarboxylase [Chitinophagaceae bacterium]